jgi:hypothetical protein
VIYRSYQKKKKDEKGRVFYGVTLVLFLSTNQMTVVTERAVAVDKYRYQSRPVKTLN